MKPDVLLFRAPRCSRIVMHALLVAVVLVSAAWATPERADTKVGEATGQLERQRPMDAWRTLLEAYQLDNEFHTRHGGAVQDIAIALNNFASEQYRAETTAGTDNAIAAANLMRQELSRRLVRDYFGQDQLENYDSSARRILGMSNVRMGRQHMVAGRINRGEEMLRAGHELLNPGEPGYSTASHDIAVILAD
ncbi:MAG: hypothetical protein JJU11_05155, partial [Candidatus Sumerlaeia bacterium]|nr:hypothetical protein [Candidatus Sumerlaeia bacterium]